MKAKTKTKIPTVYKRNQIGRSETRLHKVSHDIDALGDIALEWPGITTLGYAVSFRTQVMSQVHSLSYVVI